MPTPHRRITKLLTIPPVTVNPSHEGYTYSQELTVYVLASPGCSNVLWDGAAVLWQYATRRNSEILISRGPDEWGMTRSLLLTPGTLRDPDDTQSTIISPRPWVGWAGAAQVWRQTANWILQPQKTIRLSCNDYTAYARGSYHVERNRSLWNPYEVLTP